MRRTIFVLLMPSLFVAACAGRPEPSTIWPIPDPAPVGREVELFVATTREMAPFAADGFTAERAPEPNFAAFTLSVPPDRISGEINWPKNGQQADPRTDFAVTRHLKLDKAAFYDRVARAGDNNAGVFVHGYNYSFQEALYRFGQLTTDTQISGAPVLFAWPSAASVLGYVNDREAATYSRDALAALLTTLGNNADDKPVLVFGHSMGGWLVMEALRQMRIAGEDEALSRLEVVLAAPDIDGDVFRAQVGVIGKMEIPLVILVSPDDRALGVSSAIAGRRSRLGSVDPTNPRVQAAAQANDIALVDISSLSATTGMNHDRFIQLATAYPDLMAELIRGDGQATTKGTFILGSAGDLLTAPVRAVGSVLRQ